MRARRSNAQQYRAYLLSGSNLQLEENLRRPTACARSEVTALFA